MVQLISCVQFFQTPWTVAHQAPLSVEFSRQEYWSGLPFPSSGDLPDPGVKLASPAVRADSLLSGHQGSPGSAIHQRESDIGRPMSPSS